MLQRLRVLDQMLCNTLSEIVLECIIKVVSFVVRHWKSYSVTTRATARMTQTGPTHSKQPKPTNSCVSSHLVARLHNSTRVGNTREVGRHVEPVRSHHARFRRVRLNMDGGYYAPAYCRHGSNQDQNSGPCIGTILQPRLHVAMALIPTPSFELAQTRTAARAMHACIAAVCDGPRRLLSRVTLVYSCLVLVFCTTNVFCILYSVYIETHTKRQAQPGHCRD